MEIVQFAKGDAPIPPWKTTQASKKSIPNLNLSDRPYPSPPGIQGGGDNIGM